MKSLLLNFLSGGVLGSLAQALLGWLHTKQQIALMEAQAKHASIVAEWGAFTAAQNAEAATNTARAYQWAETVKTLWRPFLTLLLLVLTAWMLREASAEVVDFSVAQMTQLTGMSVAFWFGGRYLEKLPSYRAGATSKK